jgi:hypothetical protein
MSFEDRPLGERRTAVEVPRKRAAGLSMAITGLAVAAKASSTRGGAGRGLNDIHSKRVARHVASAKSHSNGRYALEPALAWCAGKGPHAGRAADGPAKPPAKLFDRIDASFGVNLQTFEDRQKSGGNCPSLVGANLTPSPIEQFQVLVERQRQKTSVRCAAQRAAR